jgi:hypothetical protein
MNDRAPVVTAHTARVSSRFVPRFPPPLTLTISAPEGTLIPGEILPDSIQPAPTPETAIVESVHPEAPNPRASATGRSRLDRIDMANNMLIQAAPGTSRTVLWLKICKRLIHGYEGMNQSDQTRERRALQSSVSKRRSRLKREKRKKTA